MSAQKKKLRGVTSRKQGITDRAAEGDYTLVEPLDYMIMDYLPKEGEMFAGLYPLGLTIKGVLAKFSPEQQKALSTTVLSARIRVLHLQDLVISAYSGSSEGGSLVWQRTEKGSKALNDWKSKRREVGGGSRG